MFPRRYALLSSEKRALPKNTAALTALCQRWPGRVSVMLAPSAATLYPEHLPAHAPVLEERPYLDQLAQAVTEAGGRWLDVSAALEPHKQEYLYYRTSKPTSKPAAPKPAPAPDRKSVV